MTPHRLALVLACIAGCGKSSVTPPGTEVLVIPLDSFPSPAADVRARLVPGTPPTETATLSCKDATIEIAFDRKLDPQTQSLYMDRIRVVVLDSRDATVTAHRLNPTNGGTAEAIVMSLPIQVTVARSSSSGTCSFRALAGGQVPISPI